MIEVAHTLLVFRRPTVSDDPATLCPEWQAQLATIDRLARSPHPVLVSLDCAALPDNLLENELFGTFAGHSPAR